MILDEKINDILNTKFRLFITLTLNWMQVEDIVSPTYSVNSNVLKLNLSSVASSTPGC